MIMVSHNIVDAFDKKYPASLSKKVHKYIRNEMNYDGVIITDGLGMNGVVDFVGGDKVFWQETICCVPIITKFNIPLF